MTYRIGIIGLGLMGERMLSMLASREDFTVTRLHDVDLARAEAVAAQVRGSLVEATPEGVTSADDVDVVYIATPPATHLGFARSALKAQKAIFCEKPLAVDVDEAARFVEEIEQSGLPNAIHFPFATLPGLDRIERELKEGLAGEIERLDITHHFSQWPRTWHHAGPWLAGRQEGGFLREVFSHFAYLTIRVLGSLEVLESHVVFDDPASTESRVSAELKAGSVPVRLMAGVGGAAPDSNEWTLYATDRSYRLNDWSRWSVSTGPSLPNMGEWSPLEVAPSERPYGAETLDALAACLRGDPHPLPPLSVGLEVQQVVEALHSAR